MTSKVDFIGFFMGSKSKRIPTDPADPAYLLPLKDDIREGCLSFGLLEGLRLSFEGMY